MNILQTNQIYQKFTHRKPCFHPIMLSWLFLFLPKESKFTLSRSNPAGRQAHACPRQASSVLTDAGCRTCATQGSHVRAALRLGSLTRLKATPRCLTRHQALHSLDLPKGSLQSSLSEGEKQVCFAQLLNAVQCFPLYQLVQDATNNMGRSRCSF